MEDDYRVGIKEVLSRMNWVKGIEKSQEEVFDRIHRPQLSFGWLMVTLATHFNLATAKAAGKNGRSCE